MHATLIRNLKGQPPVSDLCGARGRRWLAAQDLPADEQETVAACLHQIEFLDREVGLVERWPSRWLASAETRRLLTLPGVNLVTAAALLAAVVDIRRFPSARPLVSYLGLDPRVSQSGAEPARHGRISKQGPGETRHPLVEAAWHAARTAGPLRALHQRIAARRGGNIATFAVARKLAVIAWHMLSHREDYAFARPSLTREKIRKLELATGAERQKGRRIGVWVTRSNIGSTGAGRAGRSRLPPPRPRLAANDQGHRCRTGARILSAVKRPSSAAGNSPNPCTLARGHRRPPQLWQRSRQPSSHLTSIRSGKCRHGGSSRAGGG